MSERGDHRVQVFHPNGTHDFSFGQFGDAPGQFKRPMSVALAPDGASIAVADMDNHRIQVFKPDGSFNFSIGGLAYDSGNGKFHHPVGVAYSPDGGTIAVADSDNHRIQVLNATTGAFVDKFGGKGTRNGQFDTPRSVAYSRDGGTIAVADAFNNRVQVLNATTGAHIATYGGKPFGAGDAQFNGPRSVAYSPDNDHIAVVDRDNRRIQLLDADSGAFVGRFGGPTIGTAIGQFDNPTGVAYSPDGSLLAVADLRNDRVQVLYAVNGSGSSALGQTGLLVGQFNKPASVAFVTPPLSFDSSKRVAVGDNSRFVKIFNLNGTFESKLGGHSVFFGTIMSIAWSPSGDNIAVIDNGGGPINVLNVADGTNSMFGRLGSFPGQLYRPAAVTYSPSGDHIAISDGSNGNVQVFHTNGTYDFVLDRPSSASAHYYPSSVDYSPSGDHIVVVDYGKKVYVFDVATRAVVSEFSDTAPRKIAYSPSGDRFVITSSSGHGMRIVHSNGTVDLDFDTHGGGNERAFRPLTADWSKVLDLIAGVEYSRHSTNLIHIFHSNGTFAFTVGSDAPDHARIIYPWSVAFAP